MVKIAEKKETYNGGRYLRIKKVPIATTVLILSQFLFFTSNCVLQEHSLRKCLSPGTYHLEFQEYFYSWMFWTRGCLNHDKRNQLWRYGSSPMSHYGIFHLSNNLLLTLILGLDLEWIYGSTTLLSVWSSSCVIGIWTYQSWCNYLGRSTTRLVGSSGGVYGLIGCRVSNLILNGDSMIKPEILFRLAFVVLFLIMDIVGFYLDEGSSIAYTAHWGGAVGGLLSGLLVFKNFEVKKYEKIVSRILIGSLSIYSVIMSVSTYVPKLESC